VNETFCACISRRQVVTHPGATREDGGFRSASLDSPGANVAPGRIGFDFNYAIAACTIVARTASWGPG